jgi:hypothetical protein
VSTCWENWKTGNFLNVFTMSLKFPKNLPNAENLGQRLQNTVDVPPDTSLAHRFGLF